MKKGLIFSVFFCLSFLFKSLCAQDSFEFYAQTYPGLTAIDPIENSNGDLILFKSKNGMGLYSGDLDSLLFQMEYDEIKYVKTHNLFRFKRGDFYAYASPNYDYFELIGINPNLFFVVNDTALHSSNGQVHFSSVYSGERVHFKGKGDQCEICATLECENSDRLSNVLLSEESSEEAQIKLLNWQKETYLIQLSENRFNRKNNQLAVIYQPQYFPDKLCLLHHKNSVLDSAQRIFSAKYPKLDQMYIKGLDSPYFDEYNAYFLSGNLKCWNDTMVTSFLVNGKPLKFESIQTSNFGIYVLYNSKGKGTVFNEENKKLFKLKPNELLVDVQKNHFIVERWKRGDTIASYSVVDAKKNTILKRERLVDENHKNYTNHPFPICAIKAREASSNNGSIDIELPLKFYSYNSKSYLIDEWGAYQNSIYNLNGERLSSDKSGARGDFLALENKTPRGNLIGLYSGTDWVILPKYERIDKFDLHSPHYPEAYFYQVGFKNIFGLRDQQGKVLLEDKYYEISITDITESELGLRVIPMETGRPEFVVINLKTVDL